MFSDGNDLSHLECRPEDAESRDCHDFIDCPHHWNSCLLDSFHELNSRDHLLPMSDFSKLS